MKDYHHFRSWLREKNPQKIDYNIVRSTIIKTLEFYNSLDARHYSIRKKFEEINKKKRIPENLQEIKENIYTDPAIPSPELILCETKEQKQIWSTFRTYLSSFPFQPSPSRKLKYLCIDRHSGKYLGIVGQASEKVYSQFRMNKSKINHVINCNVVIPTQPFGFNLLGGKLLSLISISDQTQKDWIRIHGIEPISFITTSLYGDFCQYRGLSQWKSTGAKQSNFLYSLPPDEYKLLKDWLAWHYPRVLYERTHVLDRNAKNRLLYFAYEKLRIPRHLRKMRYLRGHFLCNIYENSMLYLRNRIDKSDLVPRYDSRGDSLIQKWQKKAEKRLNKLKQEDRLETEIGFYDWMKNTPWREVEKHI